MDAKKLKHHLSHPEKLRAKKALPELEKAAKQYPYCSALHLLLARGAINDNASNANVLIEKATVYAADRAALYYFLTDGKNETIQQETPDSTETVKTAEVELHEPSFVVKSADDMVEEVTILDGENQVDIAAQHNIVPEQSLQEEIKTPQVADLEQEPEKENIETDPVTVQVEKTDSKNPSVPALKGETGIALNIDDNVPRTFTFWLRRIRHVTMKEEMESSVKSIRFDNNQKISRVKTDDISKNYVEDLVRIKTMSEYEGSVTLEYDLSNKQDRLIAQFIQENPQAIKSAVKLSAKETTVADDTEEAENDANDAAISETLAKIYIDQGLTEKAIMVYRKLSLKFPEKSTYFAGLVEKLEKN